MSERSEFGRRAASAEERRAPMQLHRIGARPGASGFGYFCRNKSDPLKAEAFDRSGTEIIGTHRQALSNLEPFAFARIVRNLVFRQSKGCSVGGRGVMNDNVLPGNNTAGPKAGFEIMLPCEPAQFSEFISGLLGKPQTIEKGIFGAFEINKDDAVSMYHLVAQRVTQQNNANLVQFTARVIYDDDSSVLLNSLNDFEHYAEIRPIASVGLILSWTYLILFRGKKVPEKQEINVSFRGSQTDVASRLLEDGVFLSRSRMPAHIFIRISHTERTWGVDIESLLTGHLKTFLKHASPINKFVSRHSGRIGLVLGGALLGGSALGVYVASTKFIAGYSERLRTLTHSMPDTGKIVGEKIDFLIAIVSTGAWPRFIFASIIFLLLSFIFSVLLGVWVSEKATTEQPSYVLLSKRSLERQQQMQAKVKRDWLTFYLSLLAGILTGVLSNIIFNRYFSSF